MIMVLESGSIFPPLDCSCHAEGDPGLVWLGMKEHTCVSGKKKSFFGITRSKQGGFADPVTHSFVKEHLIVVIAAHVRLTALRYAKHDLTACLLSDQ